MPRVTPFYPQNHKLPEQSIKSSKANLKRNEKTNKCMEKNQQKQTIVNNKTVQKNK